MKMTKEEFLEQILTRREAETFTGMSAAAFQHHLRQGNITPCKEAGKSTGKIQLFWKEDLINMKEEMKMRTSEPLIWNLTGKLTRLIMNGNSLQNDYEQRLTYIYENVKSELGVEIAENVKERLTHIISTYQKTGIWDLVGAYKNE